MKFFDWCSRKNEASGFDFNPNKWNPSPEVEKNMGPAIQTGPYNHYGMKYIGVQPDGKLIRTWTWVTGKNPKEAAEDLMDFLTQDQGLTNVKIVDFKEAPGRYATENMPPTTGTGVPTDYHTTLPKNSKSKINNRVTNLTGDSAKKAMEEPEVPF